MNMKNIGNALLVAAFGIISMNSMAQKITMPAPSPLQTVTQKFGLGEITIEYSRPSAKGRTIFGDLVPFDKIWRTGANAATKITFTDVVKVEGVDIKPGTYALYTIPHQDSWEIMLYSDLTLGGNVGDYDQKNEVTRIKARIVEVPLKAESFTINLDNVAPTSTNITMAWGKTMVAFKVTTDIDARVMQSIDESMKSEKPEYFRAANYYLENGKDLKNALTWINKAVEENPKAFYMFYVKAKIEYALKDTKGGKASAEKTIALAKDAKNDDYVALATKLLAENK